jgi:hypothetical protein
MQSSRKVCLRAEVILCWVSSQPMLDMTEFGNDSRNIYEILK